MSEATTTLAPPRLAVARYRLTFRALDPLVLPSFTGSMWRGVLGRTLALLDRAQAIEGQAPGHYAALFRPSEDDHVGGRDRPAPFVLDPWPEGGGARAAGTPVGLDVTLIGHGNARAAAVVAAFATAGEIGLGQHRGTAFLERVQAATPAAPDWRDVLAEDHRLLPVEPVVPLPPPPTRRIGLRLETPLRLKDEGRLVRPSAIAAGRVVWHLVRRVGLLADAAGPGTAGIDFRALQAMTLPLRATARGLGAAARRRPATRFRDAQRFDGAVGELWLELGDTAPVLLPWLAFGPWVHVGKAATMGNGRIALLLPTDPPA